MPDLKQSDDKGVNPNGQGVAQPRDTDKPKTDNKSSSKDAATGAASAGASAGAEEDTYD